LIKNLAVEWVPYGIRVNGIGLFSFVSNLK
jgi:NAD(P)-dependent dehydrogenase (short-subunit alcohol dehydrogenase family)